jgi:hypothetical protein
MAATAFCRAGTSNLIFLWCLLPFPGSVPIDISNHLALLSSLMAMTRPIACVVETYTNYLGRDHEGQHAPLPLNGSNFYLNHDSTSIQALHILSTSLRYYFLDASALGMYKTRR